MFKTVVCCEETFLIWLKMFICLSAGRIPAVDTELRVGGTAAKQRNTATHLKWVIPGVWAYDKSERNLLIMLFYREWLFVFISGAQSLRLPWSYIHLPPTLPQSHVSAMRQRPTNKLRWEQLKSVVGTLLPSLLSLPENRGSNREGPPRRLPSEWTPNKNLPTGELHESVLVFLFFLFLFTPSYYFSFMAAILLCILAGL